MLLLDSNGMISMRVDGHQSHTLTPTRKHRDRLVCLHAAAASLDVGKCMAKYCIKFNTMLKITAMSKHATLAEMVGW